MALVAVSALVSDFLLALRLKMTPRVEAVQHDPNDIEPKEG